MGGHTTKKQEGRRPSCKRSLEWAGFYFYSPRARFDFPNPFPHIHSPRLGAGRRAFACSSSCFNRLLSPLPCASAQRLLTAFFLDHYELWRVSLARETPRQSQEDMMIHGIG
jgi:hypothetical protein